MPGGLNLGCFWTLLEALRERFLSSFLAQLFSHFLEAHFNDFGWILGSILDVFLNRVLNKFFF